MDVDAARRARRRTIKEDLAEVYTDEDAGPPEWVDLLTVIREDTTRLRADVAEETQRFVSDPDIRSALDRRERFTSLACERVAKINDRTRRLNLIAPNARFTRGTLDADEILKPLYRTRRGAF